MGILIIIFFVIYLFFLIIGIIQGDIGNLNSIASMSSVFVSTLILYVAYKSLEESRKQREVLNTPVVTAKISNLNPHENLLYFIIENSGNAPAYDVSLELENNIEYNDTTLNDLALFKNNPIIGPKEKISFFIDTANEYLDKDKPLENKVYIEYYKYPNELRRSKSKPEINIIALKPLVKHDTLQVRKNNINDLVKEIRELKEIMTILHINNSGENNE